MTRRMNSNSFVGSFPNVRMRRLRSNEQVRRLVSEHSLDVSDVLWPIFLVEGENRCEPIKGMKGVERVSLNLALPQIERAYELGLCGVLLFPVIDLEKRHKNASEALREDNLICRSLRILRERCKDLMLICDVSLDTYTDHGHDGILRGDEIDNDATITVLEKMACVLANAGADTLAPSDMMDGRIGCIRRSLDGAGFSQTRILSYGAKYASLLYGPFREAVASGSLLKGNKKTYQMSPANAKEAMRELTLDLQEGADMLMVKPGSWYLDIIKTASEQFDIPVLAYQVSGEYNMICNAIKEGVDKWGLVEESFLSFKRAGARAVVSYFAYDWLKERTSK